jgi:hypothetical protein
MHVPRNESFHGPLCELARGCAYSDIPFMFLSGITGARDIAAVRSRSGFRRDFSALERTSPTGGAPERHEDGRSGARDSRWPSCCGGTHSAQTPRKAPPAWLLVGFAGGIVSPLRSGGFA